jgi:hypothetical protein
LIRIETAIENGAKMICEGIEVGSEILKEGEPCLAEPCCLTCYLSLSTDILVNTPVVSLLLFIVLMIIVVFLWMTCFVVACGTGLGTLVPKGISDVRPEPTPDTDCLCGYGIVLNCFS